MGGEENLSVTARDADGTQLCVREEADHHLDAVCVLQVRQICSKTALPPDTVPHQVLPRAVAQPDAAVRLAGVDPADSDGVGRGGLDDSAGGALSPG